MQRKPLSKKIRFDVFKRDNFTCQYCGTHPPEAILHVDHITPVKLGGTNDIHNLVTSCSLCNQGKSATPLNSVPQSLKDKAEEIKESEAQLKGYYSVIKKQRDRIENEVWEIADILFPGSSAQGIKNTWFASIKMFIGKIGFFKCIDAAEIAYAKGLYTDNKTFLYFCGICWRMIEDKQNG